MLKRIHRRRRDRPIDRAQVLIGQRAQMLVAGAALGLVVARITDPVAGRRRRARMRDRTAALFRRGGRKAGRFGRATGGFAQGYTQRAMHLREEPKDYDDLTLTHRIETEIFRPNDVPKGQINVNVQNGVVQLRGEVDRPELIDELESRTRRIQGVRKVENLIHLPGAVAQMHQ